MKRRLDQLVVDRGLAESKTRAQALILAGNVYIGTQRADKPGQQVKEDADLMVKGQDHPWVSRGGMKLEHALREFHIDVSGLIAVDVGASTGGFTDVLLTRGATKVFAVDVGHGQLAWKLRSDPRVVVMEKTNARHLTSALIPEPIDLIVCDASFIGLQMVLPAALALAADTRFCERAARGSPEMDRHGLRPRESEHNPQLITLIKPQFEVGKEQVGKGGVVRDEALHEAVCTRIADWLTSIGWQVRGLTTSPITGPAGNVEFLLWAQYA